MSSSDFVPILSQWDITGGCNFACSFCLTNSGARLDGELNSEQALEVVDRLYDGGVLFLRILGGEPFSRKDIRQVMAHAAGKGMLMSFSTNASLIRDDTAQFLKEIETHFNYYQVSIYGADSQSYQLVTGNPRSFRMVVEGITTMKRHGLNPYGFWVLTPENAGRLIDAYHLVKELGLPALRISVKLSLGRSMCDAMTTDDWRHFWREAIEQFRRLRDLAAQRGSPPVQLHARPFLGEYLYKTTGLPYFYITCKAATSMVYVDAKGFASPCPFAKFMPESYCSSHDAVESVNLLDHSLQEIWASNTFELYRKLMTPEDNPKEMFTQCPHFCAGRCNPCIFTPCTCRSTIRIIDEAIAGLSQRSDCFEHAQEDVG
jgi:MoaA/NifB/PqqE/SkfB family radical SAM enzyme